jgi:5-methylcytosine-specific restriction protein A
MVRQQVLDRARGWCAGCKRPGLRLVVDHVVPLALGGSGDASNLQALCTGCHGEKTAHDRAAIRARYAVGRAGVGATSGLRSPDRWGKNRENAA